MSLRDIYLTDFQSSYGRKRNMHLTRHERLTKSLLKQISEMKLKLVPIDTLAKRPVIAFETERR
jgi:hypothetical protein